VSPARWTARAARLVALVLVAMLHPAAARGPDPRERLAAELRRLYAPPVGPEARWRRRATVRLPDGRELDRSLAYRDDPGFAAAASWLVASRAQDDAPLGAWLLGGVLETRRAESEPALARALAHPDPRVAFEAALALGTAGTAASLGPLAVAAQAAAAPDVRTAAEWAAAEIARREGPRGSALAVRREAALAPGFRRGVSWWMSESRQDHGAASFARLASLGVTWVSLHTWDPLQRGLDEPVLADAGRRHGFRDLGALVASAHAAGLRVMVKPHLEMGGFEASEQERLVLRGADSPARRALLAQFEAQIVTGEHLQHNKIAMRNARDWRRWFESYRGYILPFAREAQAAGADMFCVGRELDSTVVAREADWRDLVARIRSEFRGPLTYSANFDTWHKVAFWDALDFIGVSAYFPLSDRTDPALAELEAGWDRALAPLAAAARRFGKPVLLTEAGFPSIPNAARAPWREERVAADVGLQARCYEATLRALAREPAVEGVFFWLWERSSDPPFRDASHAIVGKPASFAMLRHFAAAK
jgi:hypothetical protein